MELPYDLALDTMALCSMSYVTAPFRQAYDDGKSLEETAGGPVSDPPTAAERRRVAESFRALLREPYDYEGDDDYVDEDDQSGGPLSGWPGWAVAAVRFLEGAIYWVLGTLVFLYSWVRPVQLDAILRLLQRYPDLRVVSWRRRPFSFVAVSASQRKVFVVFRGTVRLVDWAYDFFFTLVRLSSRFTAFGLESDEVQQVLVHSGFQKELLSRTFPDPQGADPRVNTYDSVARVLASPAYRGFEVVATGHSLGGALSTLFGYYCGCDRRLSSSAAADTSGASPAEDTAAPLFTPARPLRVVAFASPRVGDANFKTSYEMMEGVVNLSRISNRNDLVTRVPPVSFVRQTAYHHVTQHGHRSTFVIFVRGLLNGLIPFAKHSMVNALDSWRYRDGLSFQWIRNAFAFGMLRLNNSVIAHSWNVYYDTLARAEADWPRAAPPRPGR